MAAQSQSMLNGTVTGLEADVMRLHGDLKEAESSRSKADAAGRLELAGETIKESHFASYLQYIVSPLMVHRVKMITKSEIKECNLDKDAIHFKQSTRYPRRTCAKRCMATQRQSWQRTRQRTLPGLSRKR